MASTILVSPWPLFPTITRKTKMLQRRWQALWRGWHPTTTPVLPLMRRASALRPSLSWIAAVLTRYVMTQFIVYLWFGELFMETWATIVSQLMADRVDFVSPIKVMNPAAPMWHPKKMIPGKGHTPPRPQHSFRPHSRAPHTSRHNLWVPPSYRGGPGYWDTNPNLAYCYS